MRAALQRARGRPSRQALLDSLSQALPEIGRPACRSSLLTESFRSPRYHSRLYLSGGSAPVSLSLATCFATVSRISWMGRSFSSQPSQSSCCSIPCQLCVGSQNQSHVRISAQGSRQIDAGRARHAHHGLFARDDLPPCVLRELSELGPNIWVIAPALPSRNVSECPVVRRAGCMRRRGRREAHISRMTPFSGLSLSCKKHLEKSDTVYASE